jgi:large subunit ribosomal protein L4
VRRGGGHIFAIRPRDYSYRLNKKALRAATRMAIVSKIESQQLVVLEDLDLGEIKTKVVADTLKSLNLYGKRVMIAIDGFNDVVYRSARNIDRVSVSPVTELNALTVLHPHKVIITKAALDSLRKKPESDN